MSAAGPLGLMVENRIAKPANIPAGTLRYTQFAKQLM